MNKKIAIEAGEHIHTENSHKYTFKSIAEMAKEAQLRVENIFTDDLKYFGVVKLKKIGRHHSQNQ